MPDESTLLPLKLLPNGNEFAFIRSKWKYNLKSNGNTNKSFCYCRNIVHSNELTNRKHFQSNKQTKKPSRYFNSVHLKYVNHNLNIKYLFGKLFSIQQIFYQFYFSMCSLAVSYCISRGQMTRLTCVCVFTFRIGPNVWMNRCVMYVKNAYTSILFQLQINEIKKKINRPYIRETNFSARYP